MRQAVIDRLNGGLVGARADWSYTPQGFALPRVVCTQVGGAPVYTMTGPGGMATGRLQVDCYAADVDSVVALAAQVRGLLSGWSDRPAIKASFLTAERDLPAEQEGAEDVARITLDFNITYQEA